MRGALLTILLGLSGCSLINDLDITFADAEVDADAGVDAALDADGTGDAVVDVSPDADAADLGDACRPRRELCNEMDDDCDEAVDEEAPALSCGDDADGDGFTSDRGEIQNICPCPEGTAIRTPEAPDCGDTDARAFPGQTEYFGMPYPGFVGGTGLMISSWDFNCDERLEPQPQVNGSCRLGLLGSCPEEEGPGSYDTMAVGCGGMVPWLRCASDCSSTDLGMRPLPCR